MTTAGSSIVSGATGAGAVLLSAGGGLGATLPGTSQNATNARAHDGSRGGNGGSVANRTTGGFAGTIQSAGSGVIALATGGNGNTGGAASSGLAAAYGGNGGNGGDGGSIDLLQSGTASLISATGAAAPATGGTFVVDGVTVRLSVVSAGILAQSTGGSGGAGGNAQGGFGSGNGGNGGNAGNGGVVTLRQDGGTVSTTGYAAAGLFAGSVGGSGGNGSSAGAVFSRNGGNGGGAGFGASVGIFTQRGRVATTGDASPDLAAQSLGGGGGFGGDVRLTAPIAAVVIGGEGGRGGDGNSASVYNSGADKNGDAVVSSVLTTTGADAPAILAQSVGGGGGIGGDATAFSLGVTSVAVGGRGGGGGNGGNIGAGNLGVIQTTGAHSPGIFAESVGGGGGDGGFGSSGVVGVQFTASTAVGGNGARGGSGSFIIAANGGQVTTAGDDADGVLAQSIGGGGGEGGDALSRVFQVYNDPRIPSILVNVAIGGTGGIGGDGGDVATVNSGAIFTTGSAAFGALSQSVGGGGGDGGDAQTVNLSFRDASVEASVVIGGRGGSGGNGGPAQVTNTAPVFTLGEDADALVAQSIGGGGGNGAEGRADTGSVPVLGANPKSVKATVALGGAGGTGGTGGTTTVANDGAVWTRGDSAIAVLAESVGGGGGTGALGKALGSGGKITANVGVGGNGGNGGNGGSASARNGGTILTEGGDAPALLAQSVGGGGGIGGEAATGGGTDPVVTGARFLGDRLGVGADVTEVATGVYLLGVAAYNGFKQLQTLKTVAAQYVKQNIGGATPPKAGNASVALSVQVGVGIAGSGGSGGSGGPVSVSNTGIIETDGPGSPAVQAESVGGGGGNGGASNPAVGTTGIANPSTINGIVGVGGAAGSSGNGGTVVADDSGAITTNGDLSFAIAAESIGGGGGNGGETVASNAFLGKLTVALGGHGGASGSGGNVSVSVTRTNQIVTTGRDATAILAQSVGGGGGLADIMGSAPTGEAGNGRSQTGLFFTEIPIASWNASVGGAGGASGNGGAVNVTLDPTSAFHGGGIAVTVGADAYGVLAQSVGGGGGLVVGAVNGASTLSTLFSGRQNGNGGQVSVTLDNGYSIYTSGAGAAGVFAQSIGGGGGVIGGLSRVDLTQAIRTTPVVENGQGGNISVSLDNGGNIVTNGARADGIVAEALGGGGGVLDQANGTGFAFAGASSFAGCSGSSCAGAIRVSLGRNTVVRAYGVDAYGIVVQSRGNGNNGTTVNVGSSGFVQSWGQSAGAIFIDGAGANQVNNSGFIDDGLSIGAPTSSGVAIRSAGSGTTNILNTGTINGSIVLPRGSAIVNAPGGLLDTGAAVTLGPGDTLTNDGVVSPGGVQRLASTVLTGTFVQNRGGTLALDVVEATGATDHLQVIGSATLEGNLAVIADGPPDLVPHTSISDVVTATSGLSDGALHVVSSTPVVDYTLINPDPDDLDLETTVDFTAARSFGASSLLSRDRENVGGAFDAIELAGPGALGPVAAALAAVPTASGLAAAYDSLSGQSVVDAQSVSFGAQEQFEATVLQRIDGEAGIGVPNAGLAPPRLGPEAWIVGFGGNDLLKGTGGAASLRSETAGGAFGVADWFTPALMAGISVGGGSSSFSVNGETGDGSDRSVNVGLYGLARHGPFYASGILSYGNDGVSETRTGIGQQIGLDGAARSNFDQNAFGGRFELGRVWTLRAVDVSPFAAIEADGLWQGHVDETAAAGSDQAAAVALRYRAHAAVSVPTTLGARVDWRLPIGNGQVLVPTAELGWVHGFSSVRTLQAAFAGAPNVTFETEGAEASRNAAETSVGAALSLTPAVSLIGTFNGTFANVETAVGGYAGLKAAW